MSKTKAPSAPQFKLPDFAVGLPQEQLALIRAQQGKQVSTPQEFDIASQALQGLLNFQPDTTAFQLPIDDIQAALQAQREIELESFLNQVRPLAAAQGQLDSTGFTNRIADFVQAQSAQGLGTTADLLTQQALQDLQQRQTLNQFLPQFQSGIANQLSGLGGQRAALDQFNLTLPFQTTIPALGNVFNQGLGIGDRNIAQQNLQFQSDLQQFQQEQASRQQLFQQLGSLGAAALTGGLAGGAGMLGSSTGFGGGTLQGLLGTAGQNQLLNQFPQLAQGTGNFQFFRNFAQPTSKQSKILGINTQAFAN